MLFAFVGEYKHTFLFQFCGSIREVIMCQRVAKDNLFIFPRLIHLEL